MASQGASLQNYNNELVKCDRPPIHSKLTGLHQQMVVRRPVTSPHEAAPPNRCIPRARSINCESVVDSPHVLPFCRPSVEAMRLPCQGPASGQVGPEESAL